MKILFAGTPEFALPALDAIREEHEIIGVLTQAAAAKGRGKKITDSPVKQLAMEHNLPVMEPAALDLAFEKTVAELQPDVLVCAAYGKIFTKTFLDLFPLGGVNIHPSLLPRYRGPSPIPAVILAGDPETGVSLQRLALRMDTGAILAQVTHPLVGDETTEGLSFILAQKGADLLPTVLRELAEGRTREQEQDEAHATYCRLIASHDGAITFTESALTITRMMRAYRPWPLVFTTWKGKRLFYLAGGVYPHQSPVKNEKPGTVLGMDKGYGILINTCEGVLYISEIQHEFKKALLWRDFLNGNRDFIGSVCGGT